MDYLIYNNKHTYFYRVLYSWLINFFFINFLFPFYWSVSHLVHWKIFPIPLPISCFQHNYVGESYVVILEGRKYDSWGGRYQYCVSVTFKNCFVNNEPCFVTMCYSAVYSNSLLSGPWTMCDSRSCLFTSLNKPRWPPWVLHQSRYLICLLLCGTWN